MSNTRTGMTGEGLYGEITLTPTSKGFSQRGSGTTRHLCREYVSWETLEYILAEWVQHDLAPVSKAWKQVMSEKGDAPNGDKLIFRRKWADLEEDWEIVEDYF